MIFNNAPLTMVLTLLLFGTQAINQLSAQNGSLLRAQAPGNMINTTPRATGQFPYPQQYLQPLPNRMAPLGPVEPPGTGDPIAMNQRPPVALSDASWTYQPAPPTRVFRKHDAVTIRVDEITRMAAQGSAVNQKRTLYEAIVTDWIQLSKFKLYPDPQPEGDPGAGFESNSNYRAQATLQSRESMAFNIAASVVDIRPNGNMVLEARKKIRVNDNIWETSLTGICRASDISPDNVVLSKDLIDLEITKQDRGQLRDGYKRGWFQRWIDHLQPF